MLRGPKHRFERVNPGYVKLIGGRDVVGKTVAEACSSPAMLKTPWSRTATLIPAWM